MNQKLFSSGTIFAIMMLTSGLIAFTPLNNSVFAAEFAMNDLGCIGSINCAMDNSTLSTSTTTDTCENFIEENSTITDTTLKCIMSNNLSDSQVDPEDGQTG